MSEYSPPRSPRPSSIAVTNLKQYLLGHRRGWDDAQKRIAELEAENKELGECFDECYEELGMVQHELDKQIRR